MQRIPDEDWDCGPLQRPSLEPKVSGSNPDGRAFLGNVDAVVILPRLARALNAPAVAAALGLILIAVGIIGLATDDIRAGYAIVILIVGLINLVRTMAPRNGD